MEKPQAQTVRHLLQSTNCYLVVRKEQFGAMGIHIPPKNGELVGATVIDYFWKSVSTVWICFSCSEQGNVMHYPLVMANIAIENGHL